MSRLSWLITGAGGMLGRDLAAALAGSGDPVTPAGRADLDVTDPDAVAKAVAGHDIVLNTAAWTNVDGAESDEDGATAVNGTGAANLAAVCADSGAVLIQVSTDYVFHGRDGAPYREDAPTDPVNAYGRSKLVGERAALAAGQYVVRTAWLYGEHGPNFVATILRLAAQRDTLTVVNDQRGQPTWSAALAGRLVELGRAARAGQAPAGVYHGTANGETTWYGLAREAFRLAGLDPDRITPTTTDKFPRPAPRPAYSVLGHDRWADTGLPVLPDWPAQLAEAMSRPVFTALAAAARSH